MENFKDKIVNKKEGYEIVLDLLSQLDTVRENDIGNLRNTVRDKYLGLFDKLSEEQKIKLALLHKLPEDELKEAFEILYEARDYSDAHDVGFHELGKSFGLLVAYSDDPKYDYFKKEK